MLNFAGIPDQYCQEENARILLQSFPYDGTSTWGKGADRGFKAFLSASEHMELYDIETGSEVYRQGVHILEPVQGFLSPEDMFEKTYRRTKEILAMDKFPTFFGGEHSISIGVIKAFYEHYPDLTVVQIDAHADLRKSYHGTPFNHACAMYDASQNCQLIQVGIRSMDAEEMEVMDTDNVYFAESMDDHKRWMEDSIEQMTEHVYITLDLDAFDPSFMPATGTPEPGGLKWYQVLRYLRKVFASRTVVGFDIVELAPIEGLHHPQYLVAKLYYKMLTYKFYGL